jgi:small subunit ribosomal protein S20
MDEVSGPCDRADEAAESLLAHVMNVTLLHGARECQQQKIEQNVNPSLRSRLDTKWPDTYTFSLVLAAASGSLSVGASINYWTTDFTEISMPNHKSSEKRVRQSEKRRLVNKSNRGRLRTSIKKLRTAMAGGSADELNTLLPATISTIDKAVQKGVLHRNAAARYKSRLTARVNQANAK